MKKYRHSKTPAVALVIFTVLQACQKKPAGPENTPPYLALMPFPAERLNWPAGEPIKIISRVEDDAGTDSLHFRWFASGGNFSLTSLREAIWQAPTLPGNYIVGETIRDRDNAGAADSLVFVIANRPPIILRLEVPHENVVLGNEFSVHCVAADSDGHKLTYRWRISAGRMLWNLADSMRWQAPKQPGTARIAVAVYDEYNASAADSIDISVFREAGTVWVADVGNREVVKLAETGAELLRLTGFLAPRAIAVDPQRRHVWIADAKLNSVSLFEFDGTLLQTVSDIGDPADVAVYEINGRCWVSEGDSGQVAEIANDGGKIIRRVRGFSSPGALAIDQSTGAIYATNLEAHEVIRLDPAVAPGYDISTMSGQHSRFSGFSVPIDLEMDFRNQRVWVVDHYLGAVYNIWQGAVSSEKISGLHFPQSVATDAASGTVWIADTGNNRVLKLIDNRIALTLSGFLLPHAIVVNPIDGSVWISDTENDRMLKYSAGGSLQAEVSGFSTPRALALNPGQ